MFTESAKQSLRLLHGEHTFGAWRTALAGGRGNTGLQGWAIVTRMARLPASAIFSFGT